MLFQWKSILISLLLIRPAFLLTSFAGGLLLLIVLLIMFVFIEILPFNLGLMRYREGGLSPLFHGIAG